MEVPLPSSHSTRALAMICVLGDMYSTLISLIWPRNVPTASVERTVRPTHSCSRSPPAKKASPLAPLPGLAGLVCESQDDECELSGVLP